MRLLSAGIDVSVIALWMGHENIATCQIYIHADLALKERALARTAPQDAHPVATNPQTPSWPSSTDCDYAEHPTPTTLATTSPPEPIGITAWSA